MKTIYTRATALACSLFLLLPVSTRATGLYPWSVQPPEISFAAANPTFWGRAVYVLPDPGLWLETDQATVSVASGVMAVTVNIFNDYDSDGVDDGAGEPGISGLVVTAYDATNTSTMLTDNGNGSYTFTPGNANTYRIEVTGLGADLEPSAAGTTTVFFASQNDVVNVGLHRPAEYYQEDVFLAVPCYVDGGSNGPNANGDVLVIVPNSELTGGIGNRFADEYFVADHDEIGSTFGLAYSRAANSLFAAAFTKRHTGFGPGGTGAIYKVDLNGDEPTLPISSTGVSTFIDLNVLFGPNTAGANPHPNGSNFNRDPNTYDAVGKVGLGGLALSEDENVMWTINLADRRLYEMPLGGTRENPTAPAMADIDIWPATGDLTDLPGLPGTAMERDQNIRPFAVKCHRGLIYVGLVATGESSVVFDAATSDVTDSGDQNLMRGYVYVFDPATDVFTQVLDFPMDYGRMEAIDFCSNNARAEFFPWAPVYDGVFFENAVDGSSAASGSLQPERAYPQPWITDIEFDEFGKMMIGVRDRFADQHGFGKLPPTNNGPLGNTTFSADGAGDILVASLATNGSGTYIIENNSANGAGAQAFGPTTGQGFGEGPGNGEFFFDDRYRPPNASADGPGNCPSGSPDLNDRDPLLDPNFQQGHDEISLGGIFHLNGTNRVLVSVYDPINDFDNFNQAGFLRMSTQTGARDAAALVYATQDFDSGTPDDPATFGKGNGLGDVEGVYAPAPIEIGNRVWLDTDGDGLQDPDEDGINGVTVRLFKEVSVGNFNEIGSTTTAPSAVQGNGSFIFSSETIPEILPDMNYEIRVDLADVQSQEMTVTAFTIPGADMSNDRKTDLNDSDASLTGVISFSTTAAGENNHGLDVGAVALASCSVTGTIDMTSCDGMGTVSTADDEYTLTVSATVMNGSGFYDVLVDGMEAAANIVTGTSTTVTVPANGMTVDITFRDAMDDGCVSAAVTSATLSPCSPCDISGNILMETCDGMNTVDTSDDTYDITVTATVANGSGFYDVLVDGIEATANVGSGMSTTITVPANGMTVDISFRDAMDDACVSAAVTSGTLSPCSPCDVSGSILMETCDGMGTVDTADDEYTLTVTATVANGSGFYDVLVDGMEATANIGSGMSTTITVPANGMTVDITFRDAMDDGCVSAAVTSGTLSPCSPCDISGNILMETCDGMNTQDVSDDTYDITVTATVVNGSGFYDVLVDGIEATANVGSGMSTTITVPANDMTVDISFRDAMDDACVSAAVTSGTLSPCPPCAEKLLDWDVEDWPAGDQMATFPIGLTEVTLDFQAATGFATYPVQEDILDEDGNVEQTVTIDVPLPDDTEAFNNGAGIGGNGESIQLRMGADNTTLSISMEFASPVDRLMFSILDLDDNESVEVTAMNGMDNVVPTLEAESASPSFSINSNEATGTGGDIDNTPDATLNVMFSDSVDAVTLTFTNTTEVALSDLKICEEEVMSLGNLVWADIDNDGLRDIVGEPGLENVEMKLYKDENMDGIPDDTDPVASTSTDLNGNYLFDELQRGKYLVWVDSSNFELGAVLDSFSTSLFTEIDPNDDEDNVDNGLNTFRKQADSKGIFSGTVILLPDNEPLLEPDQGLVGSGNATDENSNLTVDFGVLKDSDYDGAENGKEGYDDRDNDGIPNAFDFDPAGYIYCVETGEIISGGTVEVISTPPGGAVMFERDGTSGSYQFFINDVPGVYEIMYTPPPGYTLTTNPAYMVSMGSGSGGSLDPTPGSPDNPDMDDPVILGTGASDGSTTETLPDASAAANPYYLSFELDPSPDNPDPFIFNNNIPLDCPPPVEECPCDPTAYSTCWDETMFAEPPSSDRSDYPYSSTISDYAGSGVDLTVEIKQPQRGDAQSHVSPGPRCGCTFEDELGPYFTCGEVFRNWKSTGETAGVPDTIIFSFSEPVLIDRLGFGGFRTQSADNPAVAEFTFFSGPDASGQKVVSNLADPGSTAMINTGDPLDPNAAINILQDQGAQTTTLYDGTYYYFSEESSSRGWTILNMDTVLIQSILWLQYNSASSDPMDALDNIVGGSPNNSGYIGNVDIFRCESCPLPVSLGSTVFTDLNNNGVQDNSEMGIPNVPVQLFAADGTEIEVGLDGILGTMDDAPGGTLTDGNGDYFFGELVEGDYYVQIPVSAFSMGTGPLAEIPTSSNTSSGTFSGETDPDDDVDNDDEGLQVGGAGTVVVSDTITLLADSEPTDLDTETAQGNLQDSLGDASGNMTLDFGFFAPVTVGDTAFVDLDMDGLQTGGEPGIEGVKVTIFDNATGAPVATDAEGAPYTSMISTNPDGSYLFENLPPGDYYVVFDLSMVVNTEFYDFTMQDAGDDALDSDADPASGQTAPTGFLNSGDEDLTLDAGVVCTVAVSVADPATLCSTQSIDLTVGASITPSSLGGTWSTPDGTGDFDGGTDFATATTYTPSPEDALRGSVTLVLTTDEPDGPCEAVSAEVTYTILKVDCGRFPWSGDD